MPLSPHLASKRIILLLASMSALNTMAIDLYTPAFPTLKVEFALTANAVQATIAIFFIGAGLGQFLIGPVLDSFGRRRPVILGACAFALGSLVCGLAPSYEGFMAGRFLQALGAAVSMVAPRAILTDVYEGKEVARIYSIIVQIMMIAPVISPVIGAFLLTHFGWRWDFYLLAILGVLQLMVLLCFLPETAPGEHRHEWHMILALKAYGSTIVRRDFFPPLIAAACVYGSLFCYIGGSPFTFITGYGISPSHYSLLLAGVSFSSIVVGWLNIRLLNRFSISLLVNMGLAFQLALTILLAMITHHHLPSFFLYALLTGAIIAATGLVFSNIIALAMMRTGRNAGIASASLAIVQSMFSASSAFVLGITGSDGFGMLLAIGVFLAFALIFSLLSGSKQTLPGEGGFEATK